MRNEKVNYIKCNFPNLYAKLCKIVPNLIKDPDKASAQDICLYNKNILEHVSLHFDFPLVQKLSF